MKKSCRKIKLRMDLLSELKKSMLQLANIWEDTNEKTWPGLVMVVENTVEVVAGEMLSLLTRRGTLRAAALGEWWGRSNAASFQNRLVTEQE